jgi:hypothetical protein
MEKIDFANMIAVGSSKSKILRQFSPNVSEKFWPYAHKHNQFRMRMRKSELRSGGMKGGWVCCKISKERERERHTHTLSKSEENGIGMKN